ncbi:MAG: outer membrane protein transport protein [Thiobacillaceae bacterium]
MKYSAFRMGALSAALILVHGAAQATNGLFMPGFGNRSIGMGGVGIAYGRDSLSTAANPANIVNTGMRGDMGVAIFNAERHACVGPATGLLKSAIDDDTGQVFYPQNVFGFNGCSESDNKYFIMPEMGMTMPLTESLHVGMAFVPLGGGGTSYPDNFFSYPVTTVPTPQRDKKLGVDLMILQAPVTIGYKLNENHAIAASLSFAVSRFRAYGLQAFQTFDSSVTAITSDPAHLTNLGYDYGYGAGVKLGWLGEFLDDRLTLGLVYNSKTYMTKFDKYRGLFAGQGDFDIPESYGLGIAVKPVKNLVVAADVLRVKYTGVASIGNRGPGSYTGGTSPSDPTGPLSGLPSNGDRVTGTPQELGNDLGMGFGFNDQTVYKLGVQYGVNQRLQVRAGLNYGKNPIPDDQLTFATLAPANTERHYSLGFTYKATEELEITGAYMYVPSNPQSSPRKQNVIGAAMIDMHQNIFGVTMSWILDPGLSEYGDAEMGALNFGGVYFGFGMGQAKFNDWGQYADNFVNSSFGSPTLDSTDDASTAFKVFGGYQINQYLGAEIGFVDFNDVKASSSVSGPARSVYTVAENDAWTLASVGTLPLTKNISVFAKLGAANWSSNLKTISTDIVSTITASVTDKSRGVDLFYGLGMSYALLDNVDLRAEFERYKFDKADLDLITAGMAVKF